MLLLDDVSGIIPMVFLASPVTDEATDENTTELVPEITTDREGRPARVTRSTIEGFLTDLPDIAPGDELEREVSDLYADPATGAVQQLVWTHEVPDQYQIRESLTLVTAEPREVDPDISDTDGYQLDYDADDPYAHPGD